MIPVVTTYSWQDPPVVVLCKTEEEALQKLRISYKEEVRIEIEENERIPEVEFTHSISPDGYSAEITIFHPEGNDTTTWAIGTIFETKNNFKK